MPSLILIEPSLLLEMDVVVDEKQLKLHEYIINEVTRFVKKFDCETAYESFALASFSSDECSHLICEFTQDYEKVILNLNSLPLNEHWSIDYCLENAVNLIYQEVGFPLYANLIVVTTKKPTLAIVEDCPKRNVFDCRINLFILNVNHSFFNKKCNEFGGLVQYCKVNDVYLNVRQYSCSHNEQNSLQSVFDKLYEEFYVPQPMALSLGLMNFTVHLLPPLSVYRNSFAEAKRQRSADDLRILGFLKSSDLGIITAISRHVIFDSSFSKIKCEIKKDEAIISTRTFLYNLFWHLSTNSKIALCIFRNQHYCYINLHTDSKKQQLLVLSFFLEGTKSLAKVGSFENLTIGTDTESATKDKSQSMKSYASHMTQKFRKLSDVQVNLTRLFRLSKKLPEKQMAFVKELNIVKKAILFFGAGNLLQDLSNSLLHESKEDLDSDNQKFLQKIIDFLRSDAALQYESNVDIPD